MFYRGGWSGAGFQPAMVGAGKMPALLCRIESTVFVREKTIERIFL